MNCASSALWCGGEHILIMHILSLTFDYCLQSKKKKRTYLTVMSEASLVWDPQFPCGYKDLFMWCGARRHANIAKKKIVAYEMEIVAYKT